MVIQLLVEPQARARWNLKSFPVPDQLDHVARTIQNGAAMSAIFKVRSHAGAEGSIHLAFKIVGNLPPHFQAVDFDGPFRQKSYSRPIFVPASIKCSLLTSETQLSVRCLRRKKVTVFAGTLISRSNLRPSAAPGTPTSLPKPVPQFG